MKNIWMLAAGEGRELEGTELNSTSTTDIQETESTTQVPADGKEVPLDGQEPKPKGYGSLILLGVMFVFIYLMMFRGPKKKQQQHKQMVQALQKNDRVKTIGGIIGTIIDVKDDIITLKIDESNNTKIKITVGAISGKISQE